MYIQLAHRHYGIHEPIKHLKIPCDFNEVYLGDNNINEDLLLKNIPADWLPVPSKAILLAVGNEHGSTGQYNVSQFRPWAKYFDAYSLTIMEKPLKWWDGGAEDG